MTETFKPRLSLSMLAAVVLFAVSTVMGAVVAILLRFALNATEYPGHFGIRTLPWLIAAVLAPGHQECFVQGTL
jgi:hypothetical protein